MIIKSGIAFVGFFSLRFGDIMGYCCILSGLLFIFNLLVLLVIPLQM